MNRVILTLLWAALVVTRAWGAAPGESLFVGARVHRFDITLDRADVARLRNSPRTDVKASVTVGTNRYAAVGLHLKGEGSFRPIDDKPSVTLVFDTFTPGKRLDGLSRIHLNNSVEDGSYMNEMLGSEFFRAAGVPAARVAHALVYLNGRRLGLYVLKEGFTQEFVLAHFGSTQGQIYEPRDGQDVDGPMEAKISGEKTNALHHLADRVAMADLEARWSAISKSLDVEKFVSFMAAEVLLGHSDGYSIRRNNFRIYEPPNGKLIFLPHGMDNLFGVAPSRVEPRMVGMVASAVMETPAGAEEYRRRIAVLFHTLYQPGTMIGRAERRMEELNKVLTRRERTALRAEIDDLGRRIRERHRVLKAQIDASSTRKSG